MTAGAAPPKPVRTVNRLLARLLGAGTVGP